MADPHHTSIPGWPQLNLMDWKWRGHETQNENRSALNKRKTGCQIGRSKEVSDHRRSHLNWDLQDRENFKRQRLEMSISDKRTV